MPDDLIDPDRTSRSRAPLPSRDAPDAPWFVYQSGPGWVRGRPYSRQGWIAFGLLVSLPFIAVAIALVLVEATNPLFMAAIITPAAVGSLISIFVLIFKLGRRVP